MLKAKETVYSMEVRGWKWRGIAMGKKHQISPTKPSWSELDKPIFIYSLEAEMGTWKSGASTLLHCLMLLESCWLSHWPRAPWAPLSQTNVKIIVQVGDYVRHPLQVNELILGGTRVCPDTRHSLHKCSEDLKESQQKELSSWIFITLKITRVSN